MRTAAAAAAAGHGSSASRESSVTDINHLVGSMSIIVLHQSVVLLV